MTVLKFHVSDVYGEMEYVFLLRKIEYFSNSVFLELIFSTLTYSDDSTPQNESWPPI